MNHIEQIPGAKELLDMVKIFETIPLDLAAEYLMKHYNVEKPENAIRYLTMNRFIYQNEDANLLYLQPWMKLDRSKACAFAVFNALATKSIIKCASSNYPFECIFVANDRLYQVIDFSSEGILKMNFRKNMRISKKEMEYIIPVIMFINIGTDTFDTEDENGKKYLHPEGAYLEAHIKWHNGVSSLDFVARGTK